MSTRCGAGRAGAQNAVLLIALLPFVPALYRLTLYDAGYFNGARIRGYLLASIY